MTSSLPPVGAFTAPEKPWSFCDLCRCLLPPREIYRREGRPGVAMCAPCAQHDPVEVLATVEYSAHHRYEPPSERR